MGRVFGAPSHWKSTLGHWSSGGQSLAQSVPGAPALESPASPEPGPGRRERDQPPLRKPRHLRCLAMALGRGSRSAPGLSPPPPGEAAGFNKPTKRSVDGMLFPPV